MGRNARNVPVCVGLHSAHWRAGAADAIKASGPPAPASHNSSSPLRGGSQCDSHRRRPTSSVRRQPPRPTLPDAARRPYPRLRLPKPAPARPASRLSPPAARRLQRPDHVSHQPEPGPLRLRAPARPLQPGKHRNPAAAGAGEGREGAGRARRRRGACVG